MLIEIGEKNCTGPIPPNHLYMSYVDKCNPFAFRKEIQFQTTRSKMVYTDPET